METTSDHYEKLVQCYVKDMKGESGSTDWNTWRESFNHPITMSGSEFCGEHTDEGDGIKFRGYNFRDVDFSHANLKYVSFIGCDLRCVNFEGANLTGTNLLNLNLEGVNFKDTIMYKTKLTGSTGGFNFDLANWSGRNGREMIEFIRMGKWDHYEKLMQCYEKDIKGESGSTDWNTWRESFNHPITMAGCVIYKGETNDEMDGPRFSGYNFRDVDFRGAYLGYVSFIECDLRGVNFEGANLTGTDLKKLDLEGVNFKDAIMFRTKLIGSTGGFNFELANWCGGNGRQIIEFVRMGKLDLKEWDHWKKEQGKVNLCGAFLSLYISNEWESFFGYSGFDFSEVDLRNTDFFNTKIWYCSFSRANLENAKFCYCDFYGTVFDGANLNNADFYESQFKNASFENCTAINTKFYGCLMNESNFKKANLSGVDFGNCSLGGSNFTDAILVGSDLRRASLTEVIFDRANLTNSKVYGISAWDLGLEDTKQSNLSIAKGNESQIKVDDLEVAQFIYLLINNKKIRNVINTVTSKAVLILGRFYEERKQVLDALYNALKDVGLVPILFDFKPSENRDLTETVQLLASMSKFVIADITDAKSIPQELSHIIPYFPSVPVKPILLEKDRAYAMFEHWEKYDSVLPVFYYKDKDHLISNLKASILDNIIEWGTKKDTEAVASKQLEEQKQKLDQLKNTDPEQYEKLKSLGIIM